MEGNETMTAFYVLLIVSMKTLIHLYFIGVLW